MSTSTSTEDRRQDRPRAAGAPLPLPLRVTRVTWEAEGVVGVRLSAPDGGPLPAWEPGAHIDVRLPSGTVRPYSLCGDPAERRHYDIAVRREAAGRGGSAEVHGTALVGRELAVTAVRNHFPLVAAEEHLLIAGGIGVTPLLPMARALAARGAEWRLVYCGRGAETMPFRRELAALGGARVRLVDTAAQPRPDVRALVGGLRPGAAVLCCGPHDLLDAVALACEEAGVRCETEHFAAATPQSGPGTESEGAGGADAGGVSGGGGADAEVELELRRTGTTVVAGPGTTLLAAVRAAGVDVESDCEEGYCGTCETRVLEGEPDHRDVVLSTAERAAGRTFLPCVSRARGRRLVLDL